MIIKNKINNVLFILLTFLFGCKSTFNIKSESKNFKKAEKIFENKFDKNGNAFFYSIGTIGYKYIWTYSTQGTIDLTTVDLSGNIKQKEINSSENWTTSALTDFQGIQCFEVLDGNILKIKFKNDKNELFNQFLIYEFECLSKQNYPIIKQTIKDMKMLNIR